MMRVREMRVARWFRCCGSRTTVLPSRLRHGYSRNTLRMTGASRSPASLQFGCTGASRIIRRRLACGSYSSSSGLSSRLREPGKEPRAAGGAAAVGGLDRCSVGWAVAGGEAVLAAVPAGILEAEDSGASEVAAAEGAAPQGVGRVLTKMGG